MKLERLVAALVPLLALASGGLVAVVAHRIIHPQRSRPTRIMAVPNRHRIVLQATPLSTNGVVLGMLYNEETEHAVLGAINPDPAQVDRVTRALTIGAGSSVPVGGSFARPVGNTFRHAQAAAPGADEVRIDTPLGKAPAWVFPGSPNNASTWAVHIHGSLSGREGAFRSVNSFSSLGYTSLVPSFRGDGDGPGAPRGAFTLGQTEWLDVEAAIGYAVEQGASRIVLAGWSSGASMALRLASNSRYRASIVGLVLISPVVDWRSSILTSAATARVPGVFAQVAVWAISRPIMSRLLGSPEPLAIEPMDWTSPRRRVTVPTLAIHSAGDRTTPLAATQKFRDINPGRVQLVIMSPAEHALEWNTDPKAFRRIIEQWCTDHVEPSPSIRAAS